MPNPLELYTQNHILLSSFSQSQATFAVGAALNAQDILISQLYYGTVMDELDTSQPYADFTQVRIVPDINGNVRYVFYDRNGDNILGMKQATSAEGAGGTLPVGGTTQLNRYDLSTGQVTRGDAAGSATGAAASTDPWFNKRGLLVIKPTEGSALAQKNEELGRASNIIQTLASLLAAQQSVKSAFVNALR